MRSRGRDGWAVGIVGLVLGVALFAAARTLADPDLWGHVRFGRLILAMGGIPRSDPFSYLTTGHPWINHEWLAEVLFAASWQAAGTAGLVALKALVALAIVLLAYRHLSRRGLDPLRAGIVVVMLVALVRIGIATVRPHAFTYLLFFAVVLILDAAERGGWRSLWALPPVFGLWVNLHGGFLAGMGVLGVWAATVAGAELLRRRTNGRGGGAGPSPAFLGGVVVASAAATLLNPYGAELLAFLGRTAIVPRPEITEWQPIEIASVPGIWYLVFLTLLAASLARSDRPKQPGAMAVLAVSAIVPLLAVRHLPLFALAGVAMGGDHMAGGFARRTSAGAEAAGRRPLDRAIPVLGLAAGIALALVAVPWFGCVELEEGEYPVRAVRLLEESGATGNLGVVFNWGQYAIWHLAPEMRVAMDGRRETVYPDSIYAEHLRFVRGIRDWDDLLEKRPTDVALVEYGGPAYNLLTLKPGWVRLVSDSTGAVFAREGWPGVGAVQARVAATTGADERACFP